MQVRAIAAARRWFLARPERFVFARTAQDIERAKRERKLAVNFNFQGSNPLLGDVNLVEVYRRLGVGHMLMAYNEKNLVGDGCHERTDCGLSRFGVRLVEEMNRVGMIVDVTHTGYRTTMDVFEVSKAPVIFSHSNPRALYDHERNIRDDQIRACAKTGVVVGITGVGLFMSAAGALGRWEAGERFNVDLLYMRQESRAEGLGIADNDEGRLQNSQQGPSLLISEFDIANIDLRYEFDWATLVSATSCSTRLRDTDSDASALFRGVLPEGSAQARSYARADIESWTQELRLVSPDGGRWSWLLGLYYLTYENSGEIDQYVPQESGPILAPIPGIGPLTASQRGFSLANGELGPSPLQASERAVFGELTRRLFDDRLELTIGGRLYRTQGESDLTLRGALIPVVFPGSTTFQKHYAERAQGFSPKFAATWHFDRDLMIYANVSRGFQFGGINIYPSTDPRYTLPERYDSSIIWNHELGMRSDWFDRTLRLDLTAFLLNWKDPQILQKAPGANITSYIDNVGGARSKGVEATFRWLTPLSGLTVGTAASYIIAQSTETYTGVDGQVVPTGADMPAAPRVQVATTASWLGSFGRFLAGPSLIYTYQSRAFNNINHQHEIMGYDTLSLSLDISRPDMKLAPVLSLGVINLTDERGLIAYTQTEPLLPTPGATPFVSTAYSQPRTLTLRLSGSF